MFQRQPRRRCGGRSSPKKVQELRFPQRVALGLLVCLAFVKKGQKDPEKSQPRPFSLHTYSKKVPKLVVTSSQAGSSSLYIQIVLNILSNFDK